MLNLELKLTIQEIKQLQIEIKDTELDIYAQEQLIDTLKKEYAFMIQSAYYNRNAYDRLAFVFTSAVLPTSTQAPSLFTGIQPV